MAHIPGPSNTEHIPVKSATTAHHFPKLPVELQLLVWKLAEPSGRAVEVKKKKILWIGKPRPPYVTADLFSTKVFVEGPAPALLHVCRQSRRYALKHWYQRSHPNKVPGVDTD